MVTEVSQAFGREFIFHGLDSFYCERGWISMAEESAGTTRTCSKFCFEWGVISVVSGLCPCSSSCPQEHPTYEKVGACGLQYKEGNGIASPAVWLITLPWRPWLGAAVFSVPMMVTPVDLSIWPGTGLFSSVQWKVVKQLWCNGGTKADVRGICYCFVLDQWKLSSSLVIVMGTGISEHL